MIPSQIGRYPVTHLLGRGGMGVIYAGRDPKLDREIAIKLLHEPLALDPERRARLGREARLLASINHPNIATIYSLEEADGRHFLTMEIVPGRTLSECLEDGPLPFDAALLIGRQIARGLEAAHRAGVIHLDLKPGNVRVTPEDHVKILDFGLARVWSGGGSGREPDSDATTMQDDFLGTPGYMSPEQLRRGEVDHRSDVWALACVLFEVLTGKPAFAGATLADRIVSTLEHEPAWNALPPETPEALRNLLERALAKGAADRLAEVSPLSRELEEEILHRRHPTPPEAAIEVHQRTPHNLTPPPDRFIGRETEMASVAEMLGRTRLLSLVGAGGSGKTRLALECAWKELDHSPDGVWTVELASALDEEEIVPRVAQVLRVMEEPRRPLLETVIRHLASRNALLILDNCEHLVAACARLAEKLLAGCPRLRLLATSRERLGVRGESVYQVPTLATPDEAPSSSQSLAQVESVQLFTERARAVRSDFRLDEANYRAVASICRHLDGIPLALELAAARTRALSVQEIAERLDDRFHLLADARQNSLPHHQTLRSLIDWSHDQLTEKEQALLRRLSVFAGGWTLESAEAVASGDGIESWEVLDLHSSLVEKSLLERDPTASRRVGRARYRMLETVREYARDRLREANEEAQAIRSHRNRYLALAEESSSRLVGPEQGVWSLLLEAEHDNFRAAIARSCGAPAVDAACRVGEGEAAIEETQAALRIAGSLGRYWYGRGRWTEGRCLMKEILALPAASARNEARAHALAWSGWIALWQGDLEEAWELNEEGLDIRREIGDPMGVSQSLNNLGAVAMEMGRYQEAIAFHEESLALRRAVGNKRYAAVSLHNLSELFLKTGDLSRAREYCMESLLLRRHVGDHMGIADSLSILGAIAMRNGDLEGARTHLEESLENRREREDRQGIADSLHQLGEIARREARYEDAERFFAESLGIRRDLEDHLGMSDSLEALGTLAAEGGEAERAARILGSAAAHREAIGALLPPERRVPLDEALERVRSQLGEEDFNRFREEGRSTALSKAVAAALRKI